MTLWFSIDFMFTNNYSEMNKLPVLYTLVRGETGALRAWIRPRKAYPRPLQRDLLQMGRTILIIIESSGAPKITEKIHYLGVCSLLRGVFTTFPPLPRENLVTQNMVSSERALI